MTEGESEVVFDAEVVAEKRLPVRGELRITRRRTEGRETRRVKLLGEEVPVERADTDAARAETDESDGGGVRSHAAPHS